MWSVITVLLHNRVSISKELEKTNGEQSLGRFSPKLSRPLSFLLFSITCRYVADAGSPRHTINNAVYPIRGYSPSSNGLTFSGSSRFV